MIRLYIVYRSSKVNIEFNIDDIYSMLHLLPSPLSQKKKKKYETSFQVSSFPFARVSDTSLAINTNCHFFVFFLDFVALTPSHDYFAYQKFRIPHQEIENPLLFFNVALNASNPQILYTVNSFFNCSSNLTYTLLHLYMYIYVHTYVYTETGGNSGGNERKISYFQDP